MDVYFIVQGEPQGKGRPRFTSRGRVYTPRKTADYERQVRQAYTEQIGKVKQEEGALSIQIDALFGIPKSDSKKKRADKLAGVIKPVKKPDCDNIVKVICDALNGLAYADDRQITECSVRKRYSECSCVEVHIQQGEDE